MTSTLVFGFIVLAAAISALLIFWYPGWRRKRLLAKPFPENWLTLIKRKIPVFPRLHSDEQKQLLDLVRLFIAEKTFHGCGGLQITDEIRVTIAAEACLLLLNRYTGIYPHTHHILVYPFAFRAVHDERNPDGTYTEAWEQGRLGESWDNGKVILSWADVEQGLSDYTDGRNVVLHEFAHQLDSEDGSVNGAPAMRHSSLKTWAEEFSHEFASLNTAVDQHQPAVMDYYGATNPAEFFAVATETFFEKPEAFERLHPQLFKALSEYYKVDPRKWQKPRKT